MTPEELDAIEQRANAATPGPWELVDWFSAVEPGRTDLGSPIGEVGCDLAIADAEFVAAARTDIPALIAEIRRLRRELGRLSSLADEAFDALGWDDEEPSDA